MYRQLFAINWFGSLQTPGEKPFVFPGIDEAHLKESDFETEGELSDIAAKVLMKNLYGARTCRWDLLHAINTLAREVTKWNKACDIRLHKLMCYIQQSVDECLEGWIGDDVREINLICYLFSTLLLDFSIF